MILKIDCYLMMLSFLKIEEDHEMFRERHGDEEDQQGRPKSRGRSNTS
jgi:hypothetical protein